MFYEKVFKALNKARVKYLVAGGIAVNLHGVPRMTQDLDLLVELSPENVKKLVRTLGNLGYRSRLPVDPELLSDPAIRNEWINKKNMKVFSFYHRHIPVQVIDVMVTSPVKFEDAVKRKIIKRAGNFVIYLVSMNDIIKMKKMAGRDRDLSDIAMLKMLQKEK